MHFRFLGTNGYHVKAKNDRFNATSSRCRQNLKYENFIMASFGRLRQIITSKSVPHVQPIKSLICGVVVAVAVVIS